MKLNWKPHNGHAVDMDTGDHYFGAYIHQYDDGSWIWQHYRGNASDRMAELAATKDAAPLTSGAAQ